LLHVAQVNFHCDPERRQPAELLDAWPTLVDVAEAAAVGGVRVSVIQACWRRAHLSRNGVSYHFIPCDGAGLGDLIAHIRPDVLHVQGLGFPREVFSLAKAAPHTPILLQDHANRLPRIWQRPLWRRGLSVVSGVSFCAREQAQPFLTVKLISTHTAIYEIPESTSRFTPGDQAAARRATQIFGAPAVLWVGHLNDNKDPLSVLDGLAEAARHLPDLHLWCCFGVAPLLPRVHARIERYPRLEDRVHLLGRVRHETIEQLMRAADLFVLGSHREGSGYSVMEALACGLPPVITDIPSFRVLTAGGAIGSLWPRGDTQRLSQALVSLASQPQAVLRTAARAHFERELSFEAVGRKLVAAYQDLIGRKQTERSRATSAPALPVNHV